MEIITISNVYVFKTKNGTSGKEAERCQIELGKEG